MTQPTPTPRPQRARRLTYANVASTLAVVLVLGTGGAYAAGVAKNSVGSKQIKNASIKTKDIKPNAITGPLVADGSLTGADLAVGTVPTSLPGKVVVRRVDVVLPGGTPGAATSGFATCGAGQKIVGGSVNISSATDAEVLISRPSVDTTGNAGAGTVPDDGGTFTFWKGTARSTTAVAQTMRVFAICATP